jgi:hypothetical protein
MHLVLLSDNPWPCPIRLKLKTGIFRFSYLSKISKCWKRKLSFDPPYCQSYPLALWLLSFFLFFLSFFFSFVLSFFFLCKYFFKNLYLRIHPSLFISFIFYIFFSPHFVANVRTIVNQLCVFVFVFVFVCFCVFVHSNVKPRIICHPLLSAAKLFVINENVFNSVFNYFIKFKSN